LRCSQSAWWYWKALTSQKKTDWELYSDHYHEF
jgi:hypothetical protein